MRRVLLTEEPLLSVTEETDTIGVRVFGKSDAARQVGAAWKAGHGCPAFTSVSGFRLDAENAVTLQYIGLIRNLGPGPQFFTCTDEAVVDFLRKRAVLLHRIEDFL